MAYSYNPSLSDDVSKLRFLLDDTVEEFAEFQDEELQALIDIQGSVEQAALVALKKMILQLSKMATVAQIDDLKVEYRDKAEALQLVYDSILADVKNSMKKMKTTPLFIGGVDKNRFLNNREDNSVVQAMFRRGMDDVSLCELEFEEPC